MRARGLSCLFLLGVLGCGSDANVVPVSGTVLADDKPLANVHVVFAPIGTSENPNPGRSSAATTDANGRFTLLYDGGPREGAVVGRHRVAIASIMKADGEPVDPEIGSQDGVVPDQDFKEKIPSRYNDQTELRVDVPPGGTPAVEIKLTLKHSKPESKRN